MKTNTRGRMKCSDYIGFGPVIIAIGPDTRQKTINECTFISD